jgi:hypothetical protein
MFTPLEMLMKATTVVYQTPILILASVKCGELEQAGIPAVLDQFQDLFTVQVPKAYTKEARTLLH